MCAFDAGRPGQQFIRRFNVPGTPVTDIGMGSDPSWMRTVLNELRPLRKPVYITENGLASNDDDWRQRYLKEILSNVLLSIQDDDALEDLIARADDAIYTERRQTPRDSG